jgi:enamine deaminase RidA (YjgF/YER057c/UK114 family)
MRIDPPEMKFAGMSQAVRCDDFIFVSGQVALAQGKVVGTGDAAAQARQCFANIGAVLEAGGAKLSDVVTLRCFLTSKDAYGGYAEVKNALFAERPPASTTVVVKELLLPELLMEIEATAWIPSDNKSNRQGPNP